MIHRPGMMAFGVVFLISGALTFFGAVGAEASERMGSIIIALVFVGLGVYLAGVATQPKKIVQ